MVHEITVGRAPVDDLALRERLAVRTERHEIGRERDALFRSRPGSGPVWPRTFLLDRPQ